MKKLRMILYALSNQYNADIGSGLIGDFSEPVSEEELLSMLKTAFGLTVIRHTAFLASKNCKGGGMWRGRHFFASGCKSERGRGLYYF